MGTISKCRNFPGIFLEKSGFVVETEGKKKLRSSKTCVDINIAPQNLFSVQ